MTVAQYWLFHKVEQINVNSAQQLDLVAKVVQARPAVTGAALLVEVIRLNEHQFDSLKRVYARLYTNTSHEHLTVGSILNGTAKLKPFRSRLNIGLYNAELGAYRKQIKYKGNFEVTKIIEPDNDWRTAYRNHVTKKVSSYTYGWLYYVLLTGDTSKIDSDDKAQFRAFGLSHLLAISGLHIGIIFFLGFSLCRVVLVFIPIRLAQHLHYYRVYLMIGIVACGVYVYVCGFSVSAFRALVMAGIFVIGYLYRTKLNGINVLIYALASLVLVDAFAFLNPGLYFSFIAVALIFAYLMHRNNIPKKSKVAVLAELQLLLCIGLLPLSLYYFSGFSLIGLIVNIVIIPMLTFIIFPAMLLIMASSSLDLLVFMDRLLAWVLALFSQFPVDWVTWASLNNQWVLAIYTSVLLLALFRRGVCALPVVACVINHALTPEPQWQIDIFDVGHGSAVLVSKGKQAILYDLGAKFFSTYSIYNLVIEPYMKRNHLAVKYTIISHQDSDHNGGLHDFIRAQGTSSLAEFHDNAFFNGCQLRSISFYGLHLESIWPLQPQGSDNNNSCVVKVSDGRFSLLLPGDIEASAESKLVERYHQQLSANFLLVPHHGSGSSSSTAFIQAVSPEVSVFSRAYYSPWLIPHPKVVERYQRIDAQIYDTAIDGHVRIKVYENRYQVETAKSLQKYWFLR
ncbi:DNA internalization-related competence protein ComEC/Rec2 [Pseudoalteromonas sp. T1lg65]|uniref:DNA internalization-related competence protein ComEC/Rec2 n=1 Tax=Pseudoalteromonas sp. T1lg65 TaxID=2077101 RepID=UPI003F7AD70B